MMTRDDVSTGGNRELKKKNEHVFVTPNYQVKVDVIQKPGTPKLSRKAVQGGKTVKPTMEIYRPPSKNVQKNGTKVHFQTNPVSKGSPPPPPTIELKSALKRSKSFTGTDATYSGVNVFSRETFPHEYQGILRTAVIDPNALSSRELMELVRLICSKAVESTQNAEPAAQMCFNIIEKENDGVFLESLLAACREWFNERDKLLRHHFFSTPGIRDVHSSGGSRRWTAYVSFLMELYLRFKTELRHSLASQSQGPKSPIFPNNVHFSHAILTLWTLLYECTLIILKPPSLNDSEVECLRSVLFTIGKQLEADAPQKMLQVVSALRDAFISSSISAHTRKNLLELIELHASQWQLDLPQRLYYFPYTNLIGK